jgi:hypothetical protein
MGQGIVKLGKRYVVWSTIVDAPISAPMTRDELVEWVRAEEGRRGVDELPSRMARVDAKGTSFHNRDSAEHTVRINRAGPAERELTYEELVAWANEGRS